MAPRRRQAAPSTQAAAPTFASLPDDVLAHVAGFLEIKDRHTASLVSRRWHAAAHSPQLLAELGYESDGAWQLESLTAWLQRHGQHVRRFAVACTPSADDTVPCMWQLAGCLAALAAAGQLQALGVGVGGSAELCVTSWCAAMRQLQMLTLECSSSPLRIYSSLSGLTALSSLSLSGQKVAVNATAQLPPNVERMSLQDTESTALPQQVSGLTRLSMLELRRGRWTADGCDVLTSLPRLERLSLKYNRYLPACLSQLDTLVELRLQKASLGMPPAPANIFVSVALQRLTKLTSLCILDVPAGCEPPPALAGLSCLQRCCLGTAKYLAQPPRQEQQQPLPAGPWARSLRVLGASSDVLQRSPALLLAATQLRHLAVTGGSYAQLSREFWEWAGRHPSLQRLELHGEDTSEVPMHVMHGALRVKEARPNLKVTSSDGYRFFAQFDTDV